MEKPFIRRILVPKDSFTFACRPGIECYTSCCGDVNIFLTPYDVIRLRKHLNMGSEEFLEKYTTRLAGKNPLVPLVVLKMSENEGKRCQFVTETGCSVYTDRPWACRMFPLDLEIRDKYGFITDERRCKGLLADDKVVVKEWLQSQGVPEYDEWNALYGELTGDADMEKLDVSNPQVRRMIYMATYELDVFRRFVMESSFLEKFDLDADTLEKIKTDDAELFKLGLKWIRFGLFGEKTLNLKPDVVKGTRS